MSGTLSLDELLTGARFLSRLPAFLRDPIRPDDARLILRRRLERREVDFLDLAKRAIYGNAQSPYRQLLALAGCEYGDLERLVREDGVEAALLRLYRHGVYLTVYEFKGRRPAVRGSDVIAVDPGRLRNPTVACHVAARTGGSRGPGTVVALDLESIRDRAVNAQLTLEARGGGKWIHAYWSVPGGYLSSVLRYACFGGELTRWFSEVDPVAPGVDGRYRWSVRATRWASALLGVSLPRLEYVPLEEPLPIARWMSEVLRSGGTPHLYTYVSPAVRLCRAALEAGVYLSGSRLTVTGEPLTAARLALLRRAAIEVVADYGSVDAGGFLSYGCLAPEAPDDVHLFSDLHALIQPGLDGAVTGLPSGSLLISSLRPTAPFVLLNVSMGDQAVVVERPCGCPLEQLGWTTHLHTIRSFEKLTTGGMTFLDTDVIRVLEEMLPARFGGGPTDYQLVEEDAGEPHLRLLVHPAVGPLDVETVADAFLTAIGTGGAAERVMALQWRQAGLLRVERRPPRPTPAGKILHLFQVPGTADGPPAP